MWNSLTVTLVLVSIDYGINSAFLILSNTFVHAFTVQIVSVSFGPYLDHIIIANQIL